MPTPIYIRAPQVSYAGDEVSVANPELSEAVRSDPSRAAAFLSEVVEPVKLDEISIDDSGRVVIHDAEFARVLHERANQPDEGIDPVIKNLGCGGGC